MERLRNLLKIHEGDVSFSAFDSTNVGPVQFTEVSERFLRETHSPAPLTQGLTKPNFDIFH